MAQMEITPVSIADLLIDAENPRLPQPNVGQREALRALAQHQGRKLVALAKDIVAFGINPTELPIIMPLKDDLKRYVVVEGNRRLTALKALENPEWLVGAMPPSDVEEMRRLSKQYQENPIESIQCIAAETKEDARHWMQLRHAGGQNEGASIVPWGSDDAARFRARSGNVEFHTQALNLLEEAGQLTPAKRRKVPATSFKRLLGTPEVRAKLGIDSHDGVLALLGEQKRVMKALMHVVNDLESGKTKVKDIYTKDERVKYANSLPPTVVVPPAAPAGTTTSAGRSGQHSSAGQSAPSRSTVQRDKLIPTKCALNINEARLQDIARELRRLSLTQHANAVSVLFRVFIELSADAYMDREHLAGSVNDKLSDKLLKVTADLISRKKLTSQQANPVRLSCNKNSFLAPSTALMNEYVHNRSIFPAPGDLRAYWDSLQPFITAIWAP
jgi:hypothetical protein